MKYLLIALLSISAFAELQSVETSFVVSRFAGVNEVVFYNCDSVERFTETMLEDMGAMNIEVRCRGGIDIFNPNFSTDAFVTTSFLVKSGEGDLTAVTLQDRDNCHLANEVFDGVRDEFVLENVDSRRCTRSNARYKISFDVLK
jgi:hypothetical protein